MQSRKHPAPTFWLTVQLVVITVMLPHLTRAQEAGQAPSKQSPASQDSSQTPEKTDAQPASPVGTSWADNYFHQIGSAGLLAGSPVGVHWGRLYIPSAEVSGLVDRRGATAGQPAETFTATLLQTALVYDHKVGSGRFAVQYQPRLAIANGQVVGDFANQNLALDMIIYSRPRWNVRFGDSFQYYYSQQSLGLAYFDVNPVNSGTVKNFFVDGPNRWLANSAGLSISYALSARSFISVAPTFVYSESGEGSHLRRGTLYGGDFKWGYRTSAKQTVGLQYTGQLIHEATSTATDTIYQTALGTWERQLSRTWLVNGAAGITTSSVATISRQWFASGSFGVVKQFQRSSLALGYSRGQTLSNGLISSQYADRVDLTYRTQMGRRLSWSVGGGYLHQKLSGGFAGWYASADAQALMAPRAGLYAFFAYSRKNQSVNTANLFSGNLDLYSFGIRWQPHQIAH
jgi:hypothetical protein